MENPSQYSCTCCNTTYNRKANYARHLKTKSHMLKRDDVFVCETCGKRFLRQHFYDKHVLKHETLCNISPTDDSNDQIVDTKMNNTFKSEKDIELLKLTYELQFQKIRYDLQKERYEKELYKQKAEIYGDDRKFHKDVIKTTIKTTNIAVSGLAHARKYYADAPELVKMSSDELGKHDQLIENLLLHASKKTVHEYLGDFLIKFYKKEATPKIQSLWSTDSSRLTFIIKQILQDKSDWRYDKKGMKVRNIIIDPLLESIKIILSDHISNIDYRLKPVDEQNMCDSDYEELSNNKRDELVHEQILSMQIISDIKNKKMAKLIIKYISPCLALT